MASVLFKGTPAKLEGKEVNVGDKAPAVTLPNKGLADVVVGGASDKVQVIVAVPSLDTPVCANETRKFNTEAAKIKGAKVVIVSMDLPFAAGRFCTTEGIENLDVCSDFRAKEFANTYGVLLGESVLKGLLARSIFVIDKAGTVVYKELVSEVTSEPNYDAALAAVKSVAGESCGCGCGSH